MKISARTFKEKTGRLPYKRDLKRVNCPWAGQIGHWSCGWCKKHDQPMFQCKCFNPVKSISKSRDELAEVEATL